MSDRFQRVLSSIGSLVGGLFFVFIRGCLYWGEVTIALPVVIGLFVALCTTVLWVTGRPLLNDIGGLVDFGMASVKVMIWVSTTAAIQKCLFGYRTEVGTSGRELKKAPIWDDVYDASVTIVVLVLTLIAYAYLF